MDDPDAGLPAYDEPLDSDLIDPDPDFRETLRILNANGVHTVSSCQGHAPGTQYPDVQEWMAPYITCRTDDGDSEKVCNLLKLASQDEWGNAYRTTKLRVSPGKVVMSFPNGWDWKKSVAFLKAKLVTP